MFLNEYAGILNGPPGLASSIPGPTDTEQKIYDLYAAIENRAPSQAEMTQWTNVFQDGLTNEYIDFITNSLKDEMTQVRYQLNNLYRQNLGREPSEDEIQYWNGIWHNQFRTFNDFKQYLIAQLQELAKTPEEAQKKAARAAADREQATIEAQYASAGLVTNPTADQQAAADRAVAYEQTAIAAEKEAITAVQVAQQEAAQKAAQDAAAAAAAKAAAAEAEKKQKEADQQSEAAAAAEKKAKDAAAAAAADQASIDKQIAAEQTYWALVNARRLEQQKQADADAAAAAAAAADKKAVATTGTTGNLKPLLLIAGVAFLLGKI